MKKLRMIVLDCPADTFSDPFVQELYSKLLALKISGYRTAVDKYLSVDESDIYATHFIVCEENENKFSPLISFKGLTQSRCQDWNRSFNAISVAEASRSESHILALQKFIQHSNSQSEYVGYTGSLAIEPCLKDEVTKEKIKNMFLSMLVRFHLDFGIKKSMCVARLKVRSHEILKKVGYTPLSLYNEVLPPVALPQYLNNDYLIMVLNEISTEGKKIIEQYANDWEEKIWIGKNANNQLRKDSDRHPDEHKKAS